MFELLHNIWLVYLDTAFWLLLGLLAAGLVKAYIPEHAMQRWLGGRGFSAVGRAALFGAPLPLCSCGVLPAALGIRRNGASKEATVSFLISTPETSIDSVAVTYALMGPLMAVYRPVAALVSAIVTGMLTAMAGDDSKAAVHSVSNPAATSCCGTTAESSPCCEPPAVAAGDDCCDADETASSCCSSTPASRDLPRWRKALKFAGGELVDDIALWLFVGIVIAGIMFTLVPPGWLAQWGQGLTAMLVMLLVGIPLYICAVASTPVAAGLLLAGVSPGTVLVFLLVGPATNIAGLILVKRELGARVTGIYLFGIALVSVLMGLLLDALIGHFNLSVQAQVGEARQLIPEWLSLISALLLLVLAVPVLRRRVFPVFAR